MYIKIHIYLFLMAAYMFATKNLETFIYYYLFILMHELSHIIVALILKVDVKEIILLPFGINAKYSERITHIKELFISLAGPLASFLFVLFFKEEIFKIINLCIFFINIIPIYPLDGGRIIRSLFSIIFKPKKGKKYSNEITKITIILLVLISLIMVAYIRNYYLFFFSTYVFYIAKDEIKKERYYDLINYLQTD